ncbi:MAG: ribose-5-phosphate isomerase RpiA [Roseinatronobacter sp.]
MDQLTPTDQAKHAAAHVAAEFVQDGMRVGLGTGSTAEWLVRRLGQRMAEEGLRLTAVPTSTRTATLARALGIPVVSLEQAGRLDLTIDGADEFDAALTLIKGGGGALLHEKIVAAASDRMIVITDATKEVQVLGAFALPVEVIPFGWTATKGLVENLLAGADVAGRTARLRMAGTTPYRTDEGNFILDLDLGRIADAKALAIALNQVPGVVENGLFVGMARTVAIGQADGTCELRDLTGASPVSTRHHVDPDGARSLLAQDMGV